MPRKDSAPRKAVRAIPKLSKPLESPAINRPSADLRMKTTSDNPAVLKGGPLKETVASRDAERVMEGKEHTASLLKPGSVVRKRAIMQILRKSNRGTSA